MTIGKRLAHLQQHIQQLEEQYARPRASVQLIAVSKTQSIAAIRAAVNAGQRDFAENYAQEGLQKIKLLANENLIWHFTGKIQSNKARFVAQYFDWVHTVDSLKLAEKLSQNRPEDLPDLNICLQLQRDLNDDIHRLAHLVTGIQQLPKLQLRGLMLLPIAGISDFQQQRAVFRYAKNLGQSLNLKALSMGMSADYVAAIAEGATMIRIGTALFSTRERTE